MDSYQNVISCCVKCFNVLKSLDNSRNALMQFSHKIKSFAVGAVGFACLAGSVFYSGVANAYPFQKNSQSFTSWLNSRTWTDGDERVYSNLRNCIFERVTYTHSDNSVYETATCTGYMNISSPQGVKSCKIRRLRYSRQMQPTLLKHELEQSGQDCRWL